MNTTPFNVVKRKESVFSNNGVRMSMISLNSSAVEGLYLDSVCFTASFHLFLTCHKEKLEPYASVKQLIKFYSVLVNQSLAK